MQCELKDKKLRLINGYGPQEDDDVNKIKLFWNTVETEVDFALDEGCLVLIQCDANAKVGYNVVKNYPNPMSANGKILIELIEHKGLYLVNQDPNCSGTITRERIVNNKSEKSVIDYFIICETMKEYLKSMTVDENRTMVLRHTTRRKKDNKYTLSDHNILICNFSLTFKQQKAADRIEIFNFNSIEGRQLFYKQASNSTNYPHALKLLMTLNFLAPISYLV